MSGAVLLALALLLAACDSDIVYRTLPPFEQPPASAGEFLGYSSVAQKRTVCGNCHIGKQQDWESTAHAGAWSTHEKQATQPFCGSCHAVSGRGNLVTDEDVGWVGTQQARYQDVQCESCHGPGLQHVLNPDARDTKPRASIAATMDPTAGCAQCHSGAHSPQADEWASSLHARLITGTRTTNANCTGCHEAKGVLAGWGYRASYLEHDDITNPMTITCAVCHDPHVAGNGKQLRLPIDVASVGQNLCMRCHHRRANPDVGSAAGPHSPEGPLLLGEAGWFPPLLGFEPGTLIGSHGSEQNTRLCASCHMATYTIPDAAGGEFRSAGHTFQAVPCAEGGIPTGERDCSLAERSFRNCTGCHVSETSARTALSVAQLRLERLAAEVEALLPLIPSTEFNTTDDRISTGEGARFNMQLARRAGSAAHNPFLMEALLIASIQQIELDYGISASAGVSLAAELNPW